MALDLLPGEAWGYWKYYAPGKWFRQAKVTGKLNNSKAIMLFDSGSELSILDTAFADKMGCNIDWSQRHDCVGIGEAPYMTKGRTRVKVTLAGSLVYYFDIWVGDLSGQDAIIGMDFMVPAGIRLDLAEGCLCLPDEISIRLNGCGSLYNINAQTVSLGKFESINPGGSIEVPLGLHSNASDKKTMEHAWRSVDVDHNSWTRLEAIPADLQHQRPSSESTFPDGDRDVTAVGSSAVQAGLYSRGITPKHGVAVFSLPDHRRSKIEGDAASGRFGHIFGSPIGAHGTAFNTAKKPSDLVQCVKTFAGSTTGVLGDGGDVDLAPMSPIPPLGATLLLLLVLVKVAVSYLFIPELERP